MVLWLLRTKDPNVGYETRTVVVRASSDRQARRLVSTEWNQCNLPLGFNRKDFANPDLTTCELLKHAGEAGVICADTNWG